MPIKTRLDPLLMCMLAWVIFKLVPPQLWQRKWQQGQGVRLSPLASLSGPSALSSPTRPMPVPLQPVPTLLSHACACFLAACPPACPTVYPPCVCACPPCHLASHSYYPLHLRPSLPFRQLWLQLQERQYQWPQPWPSLAEAQS